MDVYANNRAQLNTRRVKRLTPRVLTFAFPNKALSGAESHDYMFPFDGEVHNLYATCKVAGSGDTKIIIDRCPMKDFDIAPVWEEILSTPLMIPSTRRSSASAPPYELTNTGKKVAAGDHFKVTIEHNGTVEGITVEMTILQYVDE